MSFCLLLVCFSFLIQTREKSITLTTSTPFSDWKTLADMFLNTSLSISPSTTSDPLYPMTDVSSFMSAILQIFPGIETSQAVPMLPASLGLEDYMRYLRGDTSDLVQGNVTIPGQLILPYIASVLLQGRTVGFATLNETYTGNWLLFRLLDRSKCRS